MNILNQFTLRTLKKNKVRTLVTIIGIILSMAMFTAVTTSIVSIQRYMLDLTTSREGIWQGQADGISQKEAEAVKDDVEVEDYTLLSTLGYAKLEDCKNADKPYLFISGLQKNSQEFVALNVTEGRLPKNSSEILLPSHLKNNGGISYEVGDTFTVEVGKRTIGGEELNQYNPYYSEEEDIKEEIIDSISHTYTVSGICDRPSMEPYSAPGYMAFTLDDGMQTDSYSIYFTLKNAKDVDKYLAEKFSGHSSTTHTSLLRYMGVFGSVGINNMMYGMAVILMSIIMFGSISLIYNAFSISISERTKQFGLLKSVGATKKQMRQSVLFEAGILCLIGIPFGILAGIGGMSITFYCVNNIFKSVIGMAEGVSLHAVVSLPAVLVAVVAGTLTVFISAIIPAARAVKMPPIQAIMQSADVKIKRKKVKTSWLTYKLLGFEGMIADKNFKRNRKKYRATVLSLFMSIVLFIASSGFTAYLTESFSVMYTEQPYDIYWSMDMGKENDCDMIRSQIEEMSGVDETAYVVETIGMTKLPFDVVHEDCLAMIEQKYRDQVDRKNKEMGIEISFVYVDDVSYKKYLEENDLPLDTYLGKNAKALVWDTVKTWKDDDPIQTFSVFEKTITDNRAMVIKDVTGDRDNVYYSWSDWNTMEQMFYDSNNNEDIKFSAEEACVELDYEIGGINVTKRPWFAEDVSFRDKLLVTLPYSAAEIYTEPMLYMNKATYKVKANDHRIAYEEISTYFDKGDGSSYDIGNIWDSGEEKESGEALILIISIFSYGFIILISLIAIANVFNTISTNVMLRRREIAMLKSVGMTQKSFKKMMNYECIFYGLKGLLFGLPVSFGVIWLIYKAVANGWNVSFFIPWKSVGIAVVSVFAVVFATMMYAMFKIKDENTVEALRNENL